MKIRPFSPAGKTFTNIWGAGLKTTIQFLPKLLMALQVSQSPVENFGSGNFPFKENKPINFENSSLLSAGKKFTNFGGADLETTIQFSPKLEAE